MLSEISRVIWPANKARSLRRRVTGARFNLWRTYSRLVFGETRWVRIDSGRIVVRTEDFRAYRIAIMKGTQKTKVDLWKKIAKGSPDVCVDIGANYGEFTSAIADTGLPIISVEANAKVASCLQESFKYYDNVTAVNAAASDSEGNVSLFINPYSTGFSSLSRQVADNALDNILWAGGGKQTEEQAIPSIRLDYLIPEVLKRPINSIILKVDVEGFEEPVIRGVMPLLKELHWWRALIEFNPDAISMAGGDPGSLWEILRGYPGIILRWSDRPDESFNLDGATLPDIPTYGCDVMIGQGKMADNPNNPSA